MNNLQANEMVRTADMIAKEIIFIQEQTERMLLINTIEIGRRLSEVKKLVGHGNWRTWLIENVSYSQRTATNLIRIYEEYSDKVIEGSPNWQSFANLNYTKALMLLKLDEEERDEIIVENEVQKLSNTEIEKIIKERDDAIKANKKVEQDLEIAEKKLLDNATKVKDYDRIKKALIVSEQTVKELEQKKDEPVKHTEVFLPAEVEVIPEEIQNELDKLRADAAASETSMQFKTVFNVIVSQFNEMMELLSKMEGDELTKYTSVANNFLDRLKESI